MRAPSAALAVILLLSCALSARAQDEVTDWELDGHLKYRLGLYTFPSDSVLRELYGDSTNTHGGEARINLGGRSGNWTFDAAYQVLGLYTETLAGMDGPGGIFLPGGALADDSRRWFDLTATLADGDRGALVHRLDRLSIGYTTEHTVLRLGRQAISWGNGLLFNPMDIINPFDPAAIDTEYKTGDDMLYGQYLFDDGSDLQGIAVVRRDPLTGDVERDQSSLALKYHGFIGMNEFDLLAAEHYDDTVLGMGMSFSVGGAVWRGDLTWTDTARERTWSLVTGATWSWTWNGKNVSGILEYYYNGFGQPGGDYRPADLLRNPDLLRRIERGELYTLGRHYIGAAATIELTPLFLFTPTLLTNLEDPSALLQLTAQYDGREDMRLLAALNLPIGAPGTEYGGIAAGLRDRYLSTGISALVQLAWYF